jgi:hypothetical protein
VANTVGGAQVCPKRRLTVGTRSHEFEPPAHRPAQMVSNRQLGIREGHKTAKGIKGLYPYRHSLAGPKARQEDHYEPVGSMDASTVLYP